jgi:hypothetical protein
MDEPMTYPQKVRVKQAALRARRLYPGAVGEVLSSELLTWAEFGFRFGPGRTMDLMLELEQQQPERMTLMDAQAVSANPGEAVRRGLEYVHRRYGMSERVGAVLDTTRHDGEVA